MMIAGPEKCGMQVVRPLPFLPLPILSFPFPIPFPLEVGTTQLRLGGLGEHSSSSSSPTKGILMNQSPKQLASIEFKLCPPSLSKSSSKRSNSSVQLDAEC